MGFPWAFAGCNNPCWQEEQVVAAAVVVGAVDLDVLFDLVALSAEQFVVEAVIELLVDLCWQD